MTNEEMQRMLEMTVNRQEVFAGNMEKAEARMSRLETAFVSLFSVVNETAKAQKELAASLKHTDARLSVLINTVERYMSDGRNGQSRA